MRRGWLRTFDQFMEPLAASNPDRGEVFRQTGKLGGIPLNALFADRFGRVYIKTGAESAAPVFDETRRGRLRRVDRSRPYLPGGGDCPLLEAGPFYRLPRRRWFRRR